VDFWAEWCAPCKTLGPILERVVRSYEGRALLAKVNIDKDREAAARYGVQSIPFVLVFRDGRIAAQFVGALPESEVRRILGAVLPSRADELVARGDDLMQKGRAEEAREHYEQALKESAAHEGALLRLGAMAALSGRVEDARRMLSRIEENASEYAAAQGELARIEFAEVCRQRGGREACEQRLAGDPDDLEARYEVACCLAAEGDYERALEEFLSVVSRDKGYRDQAAKNAMVRIFALVGPRSELADAYRRKLAGALY
jgi:putative thioredoxin